MIIGRVFVVTCCSFVLLVHVWPALGSTQQCMLNNSYAFLIGGVQRVHFWKEVSHSADEPQWAVCCVTALQTMRLPPAGPLGHCEEHHGWCTGLWKRWRTWFFSYNLWKSALALWTTSFLLLCKINHSPRKDLYVLLILRLPGAKLEYPRHTVYLREFTTALHSRAINVIVLQHYHSQTKVDSKINL